jgi:hypothetical protein
MRRRERWEAAGERYLAGDGTGVRDRREAAGRVWAGPRQREGKEEETNGAVARTGTGDGGRGELAAAVTSRGSVGAGTLKPALIPC